MRTNAGQLEVVLPINRSKQSLNDDDNDAIPNFDRNNRNKFLLQQCAFDNNSIDKCLTNQNNNDDQQQQQLFNALKELCKIRFQSLNIEIENGSFDIETLNDECVALSSILENKYWFIHIVM
jgi:hypothetical protein